MAQVNIHEAKTHLSKLLERVERGEEITIARAGKPIAKLSAVEDRAEVAKRRIGFMAGKIKVPEDFDSMFQDDIEQLFYGDK